MATANGGATAPAAPKVGAEDAGAGAAAPQQNVSSLSEMEWKSMEVPLEAQTKNTHLSLQKWLADRARVLGIRAKQAEEDEDDDDESDDEDGTPASNKGKAQATPAQQQEVEEKNWSQVNLAFQESKLSWKQSFNPYNFTNWLWCHVVRNRLEESKGNVEDFAEGDLEKVVEGVQDVHDILAEFIPADQVKKDKDSKKDKKDKKDDKKDKKDDKKSKKEEKSNSKDDKKDNKKDAKKKKPAVTLNAKEKLQASNLIKAMVFGEGKAKQNAGWANLIGDKDIPSNSPWDFQLAQVLYKGLAMEYRFRKKKETPDMIAYYDQMQSLADSINMVRKQFSFFFQPDEIAECLPIRDALALQERLQAGSCGLKFDLEWYMKNGAHLLAGSWFAKKHVGRTSFQPFRIQEQMSDAILTEGPQLVWGIAPPGTGKTAVVPHLLNLFPDHTLVFICAALPVVLGVGQVATSLGLPYALVKNKRITPAFSCGRKLGHHVDVEDKRAVQSLRETVIQMNLERKANRLKMVKRKRAALDFKRMPRIWLVCDIMSSSWIIEQLDSRKTIMVIDEPPMGSDKVPSTPEDNPMAMNMVQAMLNPMYKTILMSATMPRSYQLPSIVDTFCKKFDADPKKCVRECFSTQLDRGVVLVRPSGRIAFPHELCETSAQLQALADRLPGDPLTLKAYTERALSQLLVRWRVLEACKVAPANWAPPQRPAERFKDLSQLKPETIREYAMDLLTSVAKTGDDRFAKEFCAITLSEEFSGEVKETEQEAAQFPSYDVSELLFSNAHAFPGVTLVADDKPADILEVMAAKLIEQMPKAKDLDNAVEEMDAETKKQNKIAEKQQSDDPQVEFFSNDSQQIKFDSSLVLHTEQFLKRWCPKAKKETLMYPRMVPTVGDYKTIQTLPVDDKWKMLALSGAGAFDPVLDKDPAQPVYTQFVHDKMLTNKLSCVTAGKEFTWGANLPASTVVVTSSFANSTSVSGMLQYVGRAARRGLTTHGQALFEDDDALNRILKKGAQQMSTEADTMERYAKWILGDRTAESWGAAGTDIA